MEDTICAVSTAPGAGGIAVIRISGPEAIAICNTIFVPRTAGKGLLSQKAYTLRYGSIRRGEELIDEVLIALFRAPHSFTGEDTVEITCHGSVYIQQQIMQLLIERGCRSALPGEYTQRAFMNGKMDLSQAEAVADLIASTSAGQHRLALNQMRGGFSHELKNLREQLLHITSLMELELDFSDHEELEFADRSELSTLAAHIETVISRLANSFSVGNAIKNGIPVAIIGETNAGKSTLLNVLLNEDKAIVSDIHGTTRDVIEDTINIGGITFRFIDTAGIRETHDAIESIGIDTWGVDFGLIDEEGRLLENPVHYRDARTEGMIEESFKLIDKEKFYQITGNQFMDLNTAFQLLSLVKTRKELLEKADKMILMPDLFNYFLTGEKKAEYSIASTTQLLDAKKGEWSDEVIEALGIPKHIFPEIVPTGTKIGTLTDEICTELGLDKIDVMAVAGHDTQSALVSVPTSEEDFIFLSCGTWSLLGTELAEPIINEKSEHYNITNEGGYGRKISFLKNIIGLWCIQESRRQWIREGNEYGFGELEIMAKEAPALQSFIDPDAPEFTPAGDIPTRIREFCKKTGQPVPETVGEVVRCINQSLAMKYRHAMEEIKECTGKDYKTVYMVGGGTQSALLCQFTANACGCRVSAGPIEATVLGNIALQLMASGDIKSIEEAREIIKRSQDIKIYEPQDKEAWDEAYERFKKILV